MAIVRYCRPGYGYKVQFEDGHFEWVNESQLTTRVSQSQPKPAAQRSETVSSPFRPSSRNAAAAQALPSTSSIEQRKKVTDAVGSDVVGVGRRIPPPIPGIS